VINVWNIRAHCNPPRIIHFQNQERAPLNARVTHRCSRETVESVGSQPVLSNQHCGSIPRIIIIDHTWDCKRVRIELANDKCTYSQRQSNPSEPHLFEARYSKSPASLPASLLRPSLLDYETESQRGQTIDLAALNRQRTICSTSY
jgi:hypothetical protein